MMSLWFNQIKISREIFTASVIVKVTLRYWSLPKRRSQDFFFFFKMKMKDVSSAVCISPQGEVGGPGQKGSKGDKGELVSFQFSLFSLDIF